MSYISKKELQQSACEILKNLDCENLKPKDRMQIPLQEMPSQDPAIRRNNMEEVAIGYTPEQAKVEALRCLQCKNAPCMKGCPVNIDIPKFIQEIAEEKYQDSIDTIKVSSLLPAVCGRVCPQETQCQLYCTLGKALKDVEQSVSIGRLERFVADRDAQNATDVPIEIKPETGKKVAIIGKGPAGITVAADVRREGHEVTVFEAFHKPGGVLMYGIPEFRLPKEIVQREITQLKKMGVKIETNFVVGRTLTLPQLLDEEGFDAAFIGSGAGLPTFMNIEGENLVGVFSANEYLTRSNLMRAFEEKAATPIARSKKVAILGGGNVAMDAARTAVRLGADEVYLIYRRSEAEMPARIEEVEHAKEEGVIFHVLENVKRILGNDDGMVTGVECLRYELGEPDDSGRRRPIAIENSEFVIELDTVIVAIGNKSNPLIPHTTEGLEINKWGNIVADEDGKTSLDKVYAGGDIVLGAATVILAMGEGRKAAAAINEMLVD
jgi:glutamate synthase (NADPH/NADH) small chain